MIRIKVRSTSGSSPARHPLPYGMHRYLTQEHPWFVTYLMVSRFGSRPRMNALDRDGEYANRAFLVDLLACSSLWVADGTHVPCNPCSSILPFSFIRYTIRHLVELPAFQGYAAFVSVTALVPHMGPFQDVSQSIDLVSPTLLFLWPRVRSKEKTWCENTEATEGITVGQSPLTPQGAVLWLSAFKVHCHEANGSSYSIIIVSSEYEFWARAAERLRR